MKNSDLSMNSAAEFLYLEAWLLDRQQWKEWLELYVPDCRFWVPTWEREHEPVDDPDKGLSFIYYESRGGLEDRVWRAKSGMSVASTPLPRTCHQVTNVRTESVEPNRILARSAWSCHVVDLRSGEQKVYFGHYEHLLNTADATLRIEQKKVILLNDVISGFIDFYCV